MVRFHAWANGRILTTAEGLSRSSSGALRHSTAAASSIRSATWSTSTGAGASSASGNDIWDTYAWDHGFVLDDLESIRAFCREEDARLREYVEGLDPAALARPPALGKTSRPPWLIIAHVVRDAAPERVGSLLH